MLAPTLTYFSLTYISAIYLTYITTSQVLTGLPSHFLSYTPTIPALVASTFLWARFTIVEYHIPRSTRPRLRLGAGAALGWALLQVLVGGLRAVVNGHVLAFLGVVMILPVLLLELGLERDTRVLGQETWWCAGSHESRNLK